MTEYLGRINQHNPTLNALVEPDFDRARRDAESADQRRTRGDDAALLGLPMTLKESINVRGLRTTCGMPVWKDFRSADDPEANRTVHKKVFPYRTPPKGKPRGLAMPDPGSVEGRRHSSGR